MDGDPPTSTGNVRQVGEWRPARAAITAQSASAETFVALALATDGGQQQRIGDVAWKWPSAPPA